jgi:hypothetical protein
MLSLSLTSVEYDKTVAMLLVSSAAPGERFSWLEENLRILELRLLPVIILEGVRWVLSRALEGPVLLGE